MADTLAGQDINFSPQDAKVETQQNKLKDVTNYLKKGATRLSDRFLGLVSRNKSSDSEPNTPLPPNKEKPDDEIDTPENRLLRVKNQKKLEEHLSDTFGQPVLTRLDIIHRKLFEGITGIQGEGMDRVRGIKLETKEGLIEASYASQEYLKDRFLPELDAVVANLYSQIQTLPQAERSQAVQNLSSVIYALGIPIHPYREGNGQSLKLVVLSYLHELGGEEFAHKYFPYKPRNDGANLENNFQTQIISLLLHTNTSEVFTPDEIRREYFLRPQTRGRILDSQGFHMATKDEADALFPTPQDEESFFKKYSEGEEERERILHLIGNEDSNEVFINFFLEYMMRGPGTQIIDDFVMGRLPPLSEIDQKHTPRYHVLANTFFSGIRNDITNLLQTKEAHELQYHSIVGAD